MFDMMPFDRRTGNLFDAFDQMINNSFFGSPEKPSVAPCRTDIIDAGDKFVLKADLPGFKKEDIKIGVQGDELTISAERKEEENKGQNPNYVRRERRYDSLSRSFSLDGIETGKITASYNDGVLELELPKVAPEAPKTTAIEIK